MKKSSKKTKTAIDKDQIYVILDLLSEMRVSNQESEKGQSEVPKVARTWIAHNCQTCGKEFFAFMSAHRKYCSFECTKRWANVAKHGFDSNYKKEYICPTCNETFVGSCFK